MRKAGSYNGSFVLLCYWGWVKVGNIAEKVEMVEVKAMVPLADSTKVMMVVA